MSPAVEPAVTAGTVRLTVFGEQTAAGLVIVTVGVGLNYILDVVRFRRVAPPGAFDIHLAICVSRVVAPGEQPEDRIGIDRIYARIQFEPVRAATESSRRDDFRALPLVRTVSDPQVQLPTGIYPDVAGAV